MARTSSETTHKNGTRLPPRAARNKSEETSPRPRRHRKPQSHAGRMIATGAFILVGAVFVLGVASFTALIAGYEPPGYEKEARRVRRYALEHKPDFSRAIDAFEPVGKQMGRGEKWIRDRFSSATR